MKEYATEVVETDVLILGGGMAGCGAAVEAAYWAKPLGLKVTLVDKAESEPGHAGHNPKDASSRAVQKD